MHVCLWQDSKMVEMEGRRRRREAEEEEREEEGEEVVNAEVGEPEEGGE